MYVILLESCYFDKHYITQLYTYCMLFMCLYTNVPTAKTFCTTYKYETIFFLFKLTV